MNGEYPAASTHYWYALALFYCREFDRDFSLFDRCAKEYPDSILRQAGAHVEMGLAEE
jgi:hypothetical protein